MILRALASITVVAGLAGMLWSAPVEPVEMVSRAAGAPAEVEREAPPEERIARRVDALIERARAKIEALHAEGRHEEAEQLEQLSRAHLAEIRELGERVRALREDMRRLREHGDVEEANRLQQEAREIMGELRRRLTSPREERPEPAGPREHIAELRAKIADLRAAGRMDEAQELQQKVRELAAQRRGQGIEPPRRPRPDDELREMHIHLQNLHRQIDELHAHGRHDDAERLARQAEELEIEIQHREKGREGEDRERMGMRMQLERLHKEIAELHEAGRHEEAEQLQQHARQLTTELRQREERRPQPEAEPEEVQRRIAHMFEAAENLVAAGMHEQAEQLRRHAETMERRMRERMEGAPPPAEERLEMLAREMQQLRAEVHELIELVRDLHRRLDRSERGD